MKHSVCRYLVVMLVFALGVTLSATGALGQTGNPNPGVSPQNSKPYGLTYGDWSAKWWQWALSIPSAMNPLLDTTGANCGQGQSGQVWLLAGTFGGAVTRTCTVPSGRSLFFPILNTAFGPPFDCLGPPGPVGPCDVDALRAGAAAFVNNPTLLQASVDGVALQSLNTYRAPSPTFSYTVTADNILGIPAGTYGPAVSDGYWLMLAPLSAGSHTVHFRGVRADGFETEVTYNLTVAR